MDVASITAAFVAAQVGKLQTAAAAKLLKTDANVSADAAKLLEAAQQSFSRLANVASGIAGNLDITA